MVDEAEDSVVCVCLEKIEFCVTIFNDHRHSTFCRREHLKKCIAKSFVVDANVNKFRVAQIFVFGRVIFRSSRNAIWLWELKSINPHHVKSPQLQNCPRYQCSMKSQCSCLCLYF